MPWTGQTFAEKHNHSLTGAESEEAAKIANAILEKTGDEGKAIRIANAKVPKMGRYKSSRSANQDA